jgi:hypothetical protein
MKRPNVQVKRSNTKWACPQHAVEGNGTICSGLSIEKRRHEGRARVEILPVAPVQEKVEMACVAIKEFLNTHLGE